MRRLSFAAVVIFTVSVLLLQALVYTARGLLPEQAKDNTIRTFAAYLPEPESVSSGEAGALQAGTQAAKAAAAGFATDTGAGLQLRAVEQIRQSLNKSIAEQQLKIVDTYAGFSSQTLTRSADGISVSQSVTLDLTGVGNHFSQLHQLVLVSGSFVQEDSWNSRMIALDETAAWQLFGATDIAGMTLMIQNQTYTVSGVVRLPQSWQDRLAIGNLPQAFVSYSALRTLDSKASITTYEARVPEPVPGMGASFFRDALAAGGLDAADLLIVDHEQRLTLNALASQWMNVGNRALVVKTPVLPWWENSRRAAADLASSLLLAVWISGLFVLLAFWEQIRSSQRPNIWKMVRSVLGVSLIGLLIAAGIIDRLQETTPSGFIWLGVWVFVLIAPTLTLLIFSQFENIRNLKRPQISQMADKLFNIFNALTASIKRLRQYWPVKKEL